MSIIVSSEGLSKNGNERKCQRQSVFLFCSSIQKLHGSQKFVTRHRMKRKITSIFQTQSATLLSPFLLISIFSQLSVGGKNNCYPRSQLQQFGRKKTKSNNNGPGVLTLREKLLKLMGAELPVITLFFFLQPKYSTI